MEIGLVILFAILIGMWADSLGRSAILWGLLSLLVSPIIVAIILLLIGEA